jgi:hypothetical protein
MACRIDHDQGGLRCLYELFRTDDERKHPPDRAG